MGNRFILIFLLITNFASYIFAQQSPGESTVMFYNVENLFDTRDNPKTDDENFTPDGEMHWTNARLNEKLLKISKVILGASGWEVPDIIVLVEIENRYVLEKLVEQPLLKPVPYKMIHKESPDHRGIDVGFIYNSEHFYPLEYQYFSVKIDDKIMDTREILYVSGVLNSTDTIHIFGNHWPSRYSGFLETQQMRTSAAELLHSKVEELNTRYHSPKIVIVGDFNDNPEDETMSGILLAEKPVFPVIINKLYNLSYDFNKHGMGTLKYQSQWFVFDQIIVSGSLLSAGSGIYANSEDAKIVDHEYLLEDDTKFGGKKPFRYYSGFSYNGGFSDHLPVILELKAKN